MSHPARRVIRTVFFTTSIVLFCFGSHAQGNVNVRIMAANITSGTQQAYEAPGIRIFQGLKPDVVAIQEFNYAGKTPAEMRAFVDTAFGTNYSYYRESGSFQIPNGIISRYPILTNNSWPDSVVANRSFAWARIDLPGTNDLYVISVHLLSSGTAADRDTEANEIKDKIATDFPPGAWVIVGGDFNVGSRTEAAVNTFKTILSDSPIPTDLISGGDPDTNEPRNNPYDYVMPSFTLANYQVPVVIGPNTFPNGLVFDSTVFANNYTLSAVSPVQSGDSHVSGMQHMGVVKDFLIPVSGTVTTNPPVIGTQPQSQGVATGNPVTFSVSATGTAPLSYQWQFSGTNISGATTNPFVLANAQLTNAGDYSVVVTNIAGSVTSSVAVLTVTNAAPVISTQPQGQSILAGQSATFSVTATGSLPLNYQWRLGGTNLSGATTNPLVIGSAQTTDEGSYSVVITNVAGSVTSSPALLTIRTNVTGTTVLLAGWDTSAQSNFGTSPLPPSTNAPNLTIVGLTRGSGVQTTQSASAGGWGGNGFDAANAAAAVSAGDYATFSLAINTGYTVSFGSINRFDYRRSSTGPAAGVLQYQVGAGGFNDITSLSYPTSGSGASLGAIDLSGITSLQNVSSNTVVTFRIVNYGGASGGTWYVYNTISGTAPDLIVQGIINSISSPANPPATNAVLSTPVFSAGQFQMLVTGTASSNYVVQVTTNLAPANWVGQFTNPSPFTFTDANLTAPQKFYRAIVQP